MAETVKNSVEPLVAIGIPVFNGAAYIEECLISICNQTYQNWECVVIDNCSTDNTNSIVTRFIDKESRIRLIKNKDFLVVMQNWNESYKHVSEKAKYFKVVPADDWLFENYLTEMVGLMEKHPEVGICSSYRIDGSLVRGNGLDFYQGNVFNGKQILADELVKKIDVTGSGNTVIYRNSLLQNLNTHPKIFNEVSLHVDTELAYDLLVMSDFGFIFKVLSYTRRHNESITNSIVYKLNTSICFRDNQLMKYANLIPDFSRYYKRFRYDYVVIYLKKYLQRDLKWLKWHKSHLDYKITKSEILKTIIRRNIFRNPFKNTEE